MGSPIFPDSVSGKRVGTEVPRAGKQLKQLVNTYERETPRYAQTNVDILKKVVPQLNELELQQYLQNASGYADINRQIQNKDALNSISLDQQALAGGGRDLALQAMELERLTSPEWAKSMQVANQGFQSLIGGMDPNKLSGAEMANVERGVNRLNARTGNLNTADSTTTAANAMQFGGALDAKRQQFGQALNLFPGISAQSRSTVDAYGIGTGKNSKASFSPQSFQTGAAASSVNAQNQGLMDTLTGVQNQRNQLNYTRKTADESAQGATGSCMGCYIFREVYGYPDAPMYIRWCRDFFYAQDPKIAKGYRKMSYWLIPLMQHSKIVRYLATNLVVAPLSFYGQYLTGQSKWKYMFKPVAKFWLKFWSYTGK